MGKVYYDPDKDKIIHASDDGSAQEYPTQPGVLDMLKESTLPIDIKAQIATARKQQTGQGDT